MTRFWRICCSLLAYGLNLAGTVCLFFSLKLAPGLHLGNGGVRGPAAIVLANRIWLINLGWILLGSGFLVHMVLTFYADLKA